MFSPLPENYERAIAEIKADRQEIIRQANELKTLREKLRVAEKALSRTYEYVDQTYSDLIGNLGSEWLAARYADDLLPQIRKALAKIRSDK